MGAALGPKRQDCTKIHATCDALGNPTGFHLTAGQAHDQQGADVLLPQSKASTIIAGKAYDAHERVIAALHAAGKTVVIPTRRNNKNPRQHDSDLYKARHVIENLFAKLKQYRCIATRYDKTSSTFGGDIHLAAAMIWLI